MFVNVINKNVNLLLHIHVFFFIKLYLATAQWLECLVQQLHFS
jgi:hypothetical protein